MWLLRRDVVVTKKICGIYEEAIFLRRYVLLRREVVAKKRCVAKNVRREVVAKKRSCC